MRTPELVLIVSVAVAVLWSSWLSPGLAASRKAPLLGLCLVAAMATWTSGVLWQLTPVYLCAGLVVLHELWRRRRSREDSRRRYGAGLVAVGIVLLVISTALLAAFPVARFPDVSGPHAVGTVTVHWTDRARLEAHGPESGRHRELMIRFWYPATKPGGANATRAVYLEHELSAYSPRNHPTWPVFKHHVSIGHVPVINRGVPLILNHAHAIETGAFADAAVSTKRPRFPVLIYSHGFGLGDHVQSTFLAEDLASRGFVVASINHTFGSNAVVFPDGRIVRHNNAGVPFGSSVDVMAAALRRELDTWTADMRFVIDRLAKDAAAPGGLTLAKSLDLSSVGVFGHSFGGQAAVEACRRDDRLRACAIMDGWGTVRDAAVEKPVLFMQSEVLAGSEQAYNEDLRALYRSVRGDGYYVRLKGMRHLNFTDLPLLSPLVQAMGVTGPIGGERGLRLVSDYLGRFFAHYLGGGSADAAPAAWPVPPPEEVLFEFRRADAH